MKKRVLPGRGTGEPNFVSLGFVNFAQKGCFEQEAAEFLLPCLCHLKYTRQGELFPAVSERSFCVAVV